VILLVILRFGICCGGLQSPANRNSSRSSLESYVYEKNATTCILLQSLQNRIKIRSALVVVVGLTAAVKLTRVESAEIQKKSARFWLLFFRFYSLKSGVAQNRDAN
jgi:hypothetical protein